jgi:hypothetical protein
MRTIIPAYVRASRYPHQVLPREALNGNGEVPTKIRSLPKRDNPALCQLVPVR